MARPFKTGDAKGVIAEHRRVLEGLHAAEPQVNGFREEIRRALEDLAMLEVYQILLEIPLVELNRDKRGFRIKSMRDQGFRNIADVVAAPVQAIAAVQGVSEDGAYQIKQIAESIAVQARRGVKIRLSLDSKTEEAAAVVLAVSKYRQALASAAVCRGLLADNQGGIEAALADLDRTRNSFQWLFASREKKERASEAYGYLTWMLEGDYGQKARTELAELARLPYIPASEAWEDFAAHSIRFFQIIEEVQPSLLGNDDGRYGLPEDLGQQIQAQPFFPEGLQCDLRRYQELGVKYILHQQRVLLGDEMGLGKTVQAIAAMVSLRNTGGTHFVVVCPASVVTNWCREVRHMSDLRVFKVHGQDRNDALAAWFGAGGVAVTTYETTAGVALPEDFRFTMLVVDEAHYIKNPEAQRTANVKRLGEHADRLLFMTGTALENRVDEMVELIQVLQPAVAQSVRGMAALARAPQFRAAVAPVYYRRKREEVLTELPELIESREWCTLNGPEEDAYERAVLNRNFAEARRVSWNVGELRYSSKAERLLELVEEAESEGRKVLVFSFFLDTIRGVHMLLGDRCMAPINGSVSPQRRQEIIDEFDKAPAGTVLVAQIQSGGTGLNIQSASVVILCEPQFKPSVENQAISRAYRMGQTRNVLVYRLLCEDTVDERILSVLESKQRIFDAFADKSEAAKQTMELDDKSFGKIIQEEIDRINAKHGTVPAQEAPASGGSRSGSEDGSESVWDTQNEG